MDQHVRTGTAPDEDGLHSRRGDDEQPAISSLRQRQTCRRYYAFGGSFWYAFRDADRRSFWYADRYAFWYADGWSERHADCYADGWPDWHADRQTDADADADQAGAAGDSDP